MHFFFFYLGVVSLDISLDKFQGVVSFGSGLVDVFSPCQGWGNRNL